MTDQEQILGVLNQILATQKQALACIAVLVGALVYILLKVAAPYWSLFGV